MFRPSYRSSDRAYGSIFIRKQKERTANNTRFEKQVRLVCKAEQGP